MMMVHVNDLEKKIESIINFTNDEEVLRDCTSWLETIGWYLLSLRFGIGLDTSLTRLMKKVCSMRYICIAKVNVHMIFMKMKRELRS
jgi:hypothetical protein